MQTSVKDTVSGQRVPAAEACAKGCAFHTGVYINFGPCSAGGESGSGPGDTMSYAPDTAGWAADCGAFTLSWNTH